MDHDGRERVLVLARAALAVRKTANGQCACMVCKLCDASGIRATATTTMATKPTTTAGGFRYSSWTVRKEANSRRWGGGIWL